jgi:hypothetical protein
MQLNPRWTDKLRVAVRRLATGQFRLRHRQGLLGRSDAAILARFHVLVLLEREEEFARCEIVLLACGHPDSRSDFLLLHKKHSAAIKFPQNTAAKRNVAHHVRFSMH